MLSRVDTKGYTKPTVWCGPSAVSILTGRPLVETTSRLAVAGGISYKQLDGVWSEDCLLVLHDYGFSHQEIPVVGSPRLSTFMRTPRPFPMLIELPGHLITAHFGYCADNWTMKPVPFADFPKPNRRVIAAWSIMPCLSRASSIAS